MVAPVPPLGTERAAARFRLATLSVVMVDEAAERGFLATLASACEGRSLLLITHALTGAEPLDRVLRLAGGRLLAATA